MTLFQRESHHGDLKAQAHRILDDARAGLNVDLDSINWALRMTGDLQ